MTPVVASVDLPTGVTLPYVEQGDPSGVPVVMLHGITDSWRSFECVLPHLPPSLHAFALTQRGHGDASRPGTGYRTRDFAADVAAFLDARGIDRAIVVGHSMGAANALRFVADHPDRTLGLALIAAFATFRENPGLVEFWESAIAPLTDPVPPELAREFQESTLARPLPAAFLDMVVAESLKAPAHVWRSAFEGLFDDDFVEGMGRVRVPTLLLWGDRDSLVPRGDQDTLLAAIPGSRLVVYPGAGHALHWEAPARFAADLAAVADQVRGTAP